MKTLYIPTDILESANILEMNVVSMMTSPFKLPLVGWNREKQQYANYKFAINENYFNDEPSIRKYLRQVADFRRMCGFETAKLPVE